MNGIKNADIFKDAKDAIVVDGVHKKFRVFYDKSHSLKEKVLFRNRNRYEDRWVLKGIDMKIKKGEAVGLVGENGCGKSTLLKMMTKIMYPDKGEITTYGRISSLIELGAGFHPDMSGRENIFTNASILGLKQHEIEKRVPDIIAFSELEEFIDNPVRTYSSGMYMRLAFAVAINVDADILLIDEILAVGDANFQAKCFNRLREIKREGVTIVIVSHSLGQIEQICDTSYWIESGLIKTSGSPHDVHEDYMDYMNEKRRGREEKELEERRAKRELERKAEQEERAKMEAEERERLEAEDEERRKAEELTNRKRWGTGEVKITDVKLLDSGEQESYTFNTGEFMKIRVDYTSNKELDEPVVGIGIFRNDGVQCYGTNTLIDKIHPVSLESSGYVEFNILKNNLLTGVYSLDVAIHAVDETPYDYYRDTCEFSMTSKINDAGFVRLDHEWSFK